MKQILRSLFVVILIAASVSGATAQTPLEFNDKLSSITDSLYVRGQQWGAKFNEAYKKKDFPCLAPSRRELEKFVDASIVRVKVMKDVKNSQKLRMAMLNFLQFEKGMITKAFRPIENMSSSATEEDVRAALDRLTEFSKEEGVELGKVGKAQEEYAAANGFTIEPAKAEDPDK